MRNSILVLTALVAMAHPVAAQELVISGVVDGPLTGGIPKAVEIYVVSDVADLSVFGVGSANNGGGSDGEEFTFPAVAATAGEFIYVASESTGFTSFFGFAPDYTSLAASINGDDAIELFRNGARHRRIWRHQCRRNRASLGLPRRLGVPGQRHRAGWQYLCPGQLDLQQSQCTGRRNQQRHCCSTFPDRHFLHDGRRA